MKFLILGGYGVFGARLAQLSADYDSLFATHNITTGWREECLHEPVYPQVLGPAFARLPPILQALHRPGPKSRWRGEASVTAPARALPQLLARIFSFPKPAKNVPVTVTLTTDKNGVETWERNFGGQIMRSTQAIGTGRSADLMEERFGPLRFGLALVMAGRQLTLVPRRWSFLGLPLPRTLLPYGENYEREEGGRFRFHVEICVPLIGKVVTYDGWLLPVPD